MLWHKTPLFTFGDNEVFAFLYEGDEMFLCEGDDMLQYVPLRRWWLFIFEKRRDDGLDQVWILKIIWKACSDRKTICGHSVYSHFQWAKRNARTCCSGVFGIGAVKMEHAIDLCGRIQLDWYWTDLRRDLGWTQLWGNDVIDGKIGDVTFNLLIGPEDGKDIQICQQSRGSVQEFRFG